MNSSAIGFRSEKYRVHNTQGREKRVTFSVDTRRLVN